MPPTSAASAPPAGLAEADMAGVVDKLRQVRAIDPAAEQKLLDQLRTTPANSWPLVAEQFRASLAYHEQLKTIDRKRPGDADSLADGRLAMREGAATTSPRVPLRINTADDPTRLTSSATGYDSTPIGSLVDPHRVVADDASMLASSSPHSLPSPAVEATGAIANDAHAAPADFAADAQAQPIDAAPSARRLPNTIDTAVVNTKLETPVDKSSKQSTKESAPDADWQQLVHDAAADLAGRVADSPSTTAEIHQHVSLRVLSLLAGDTEKALEPIPHITPAEQDYWSRQLFALATYLDHHAQPDDKRRAAASVTHLDEAVSNLRELGALSLRSLAFCKTVHGYGAIEPYDKDSFSPGQQVTLYVEVENYHSRSTDKGFCTSLGSTYELLDEHGTRVGGEEFPDIDDCCRSRRRDFHIQFGLKLPEKLPPGKYQLQLVVKDRQSDKIGHATAAFEIRGAATGVSATK
jgi:hypothetical protein